MPDQLPPANSSSNSEESSSNQPDNPSGCCCPLERELQYNKERIRLVELWIEKQDQTFATLDRKAILLASLYVAVTGYLLSSKEIEVQKAIFIIAIILNLVAACLSAAVLYPRIFWIAGDKPGYTGQEKFRGDVNQIWEHLLERYAKRAKRNGDLLDTKNKWLGRSLWVGGLGVVLTCIWKLFVIFEDCLRSLCMLIN